MERSVFGPVYRDALQLRLCPGPGREPLAVEVELSPCVMIPGESFARVRVGAWNTYEFVTGYRLNCERASIVSFPGREGTELLLIECDDATFGTGPCLREYFGLTGEGRLALVRLETPMGMLVGPQSSADRGIGPPPPRRDREQWRAALVSKDPVQVLEALSWVLAWSVTAMDEEVRAAIADHTVSADPWIAETSRAVARFLSQSDPRQREWYARMEAERQAELAERGPIPELVLTDGDIGHLGLESAIGDELRGRDRMAATHYYHAMIEARTGGSGNFERELERVFELEPSWSGPWSLRAQERERRGDRAGALTDLIRAAELEPRVERFLDLAMAHVRWRDDAGALPWFDRALATRPEYHPARLLRAAARERHGDLRGALGDYEALVAGGVYEVHTACRGVERVGPALRLRGEW